LSHHRKIYFQRSRSFKIHKLCFYLLLYLLILFRLLHLWLQRKRWGSLPFSTFNLNPPSRIIAKDCVFTTSVDLYIFFLCYPTSPFHLDQNVNKNEIYSGMMVFKYQTIDVVLNKPLPSSSTLSFASVSYSHPPYNIGTSTH
jgi:hypothetical protein